MTDTRLSNVSAFTATVHHDVPDGLTPELNMLDHDLTVCVIGAGKGIGEHIAYAYARAGVRNIVIAARSSSDLARVAENVRALNEQVQVEFSTCNVADASSVGHLAEFVREKFTRLDVLIMNAGYAGPVTLKVHEGQPQWVQQAFDVNAMGTYHAAHYFIPLLLDTPNGAKTFFSIGSLAALIRRGPIANTGYCISKLAQARFVEMLAEQYTDHGLLAVNIHPGAVKTSMAEGNTPDVFLPYLIDDVALCGATCVWLSHRVKDIDWLSGRLISANWDMQELLAKKDEIVHNDLLKLAMATGVQLT